MNSTFPVRTVAWERGQKGGDTGALFGIDLNTLIKLYRTAGGCISFMVQTQLQLPVSPLTYITGEMLYTQC